MRLLITLPATLCGALYMGHIASGTPVIPADYPATPAVTFDAEVERQYQASIDDPYASTSPSPSPAPSVRPADATPITPCRAHITVFEDGSWVTGPLISDGKVLDPTWGDEDSMPKWGWRPFLPDGTRCEITLARP